MLAADALRCLVGRPQPAAERVRRNWMAAAGLGVALAFSPSVGSAGPFAQEDEGVPGNSALFVGWAARVVAFSRPNPDSGGYARDNQGVPCEPAEAVVGPPALFTLDGATRHVLSLGNGGSVTLGFETPIRDGPGPDFAVFENAFVDASDWTGTSREGSTSRYVFAELAFVEVATRTTHWARFPTVCLNTQVLYALNNLAENRFASQDVTLLDGFAGKHRIEFGTPFDLAALTNHPNVLAGYVDLQDIRYVRLTDVAGDGSATDSAGRPVYDPYYDPQIGFPAAWPESGTDGFDLRGVGVLHAAGVEWVRANGTLGLRWYAASGAVYRIQGAESLAGPWADCGPPVAGDRSWHLMPITPGARTGFYRWVREETEGS